MAKKKNELNWLPQLTEDSIEFTYPEIMAKLVATIDKNGDPHITMIASNKAVDNKVVKWGQFTQGTSKENVFKDPKQGILFMNVDMPFKFLQIKADFDHCSTEAKYAEDFNKTDLFRYNVYMRIERVFFNNVKAARPIRNISLMGIMKGMLANLGGNRKNKTGKIEKRLPDFGMKLFNGLVFPKFLAYLDPKDGYPIIIPCFQARALEHKTIVFPLTQFKEDIQQIPEGCKIAVFGMDFETETMLVKGTYLGIEKGRGIIDIEQVYNSMPPKAGYIYPELEVRKKVTKFPI